MSVLRQQQHDNMTTFDNLLSELFKRYSCTLSSKLANKDQTNLAKSGITHLHLLDGSNLQVDVLAARFDPGSP